MDKVILLAAVSAQDYVPVESRVRPAFPRLNDPGTAVRNEAARVLAGLARGNLVFHRDQGDRSTARRYAEKLRSIGL